MKTNRWDELDYNYNVENNSDNQSDEDQNSSDNSDSSNFSETSDEDNFFNVVGSKLSLSNVARSDQSTTIVPFEANRSRCNVYVIGGRNYK